MPLYWFDNPVLRHFFVCNEMNFSIFIIGFGRDRSRPVRTYVGDNKIEDEK